MTIGSFCVWPVFLSTCSSVSVPLTLQIDRCILVPNIDKKGIFQVQQVDFGALLFTKHRLGHMNSGMYNKKQRTRRFFSFYSWKFGTKMHRSICNVKGTETEEQVDRKTGQTQKLPSIIETRISYPLYFFNNSRLKRGMKWRTHCILTIACVYQLFDNIYSIRQLN